MRRSDFRKLEYHPTTQVGDALLRAVSLVDALELLCANPMCILRVELL
jgi:hypothetical protein